MYVMQCKMEPPSIQIICTTLIKKQNTEIKHTTLVYLEATRL